MTARLLDGKDCATRIKADLKARVERLLGIGVTPKLAIVLASSDAASEIYAKSKAKSCLGIGAQAEMHIVPGETALTRLPQLLRQLSSDKSVHGIFVEFPLPLGIDETEIRNLIPPIKDIDGVHPLNFGRLAQGLPTFVPCTPLAVQLLLKDGGIPIAGKHVVICGRSNVVGKPLAMLLWQKGPAANATVTVCHTGSNDIKAIAREADILVAAMGQKEMVTEDWIKPGAVVVDVGIHARVDGSLCGDVNFEEVKEAASWITPVPGGVGPVTVAVMLSNLVRAAEEQTAKQQGK